MGSILFTTRNHQATVRLDIPGCGVLTTTEMDRVEATELLQANLKANQFRDTESTMGLLEFLADLPLAIKQASAFMAQTGMTTTRYLSHCRSDDKTSIKLLSKDFGDRSRYTDIKNPITTTWLISFEHISRDNPLAARYLKFMSFLAEKDIPRSLLPSVDEELDADEAIGTLKAYAFITQRGEQDSFDIHRLVRLAMQNWLNDRGEQQECASEVIRQINAIFLSPKHENRDIWMKYSSHTQTVLKFGKGCTDESSLFSKVGTSCRILGRYQEAEQMYRQAFELEEKILGREHPDTLASISNLATILQYQGKYKEAEQMHQEVFELREKVLDEEHPDTLDSMNSLASVLRHQGRYKEAEQMCLKVFELREKVLGEEHPDTLFSMSNLASALRHQGKYKEADQMHQKAFELKEKVLGEEHPATLASISRLASSLRHQKKYKEAAQMHQKALGLKEKVLGEEHPDTLASMNSLANVLYYQMEYEEAEQMYRQSFELSQKVLGEEHPTTRSSRNNLALCLRAKANSRKS